MLNKINKLRNDTARLPPLINGEDLYDLAKLWTQSGGYGK